MRIQYLTSAAALGFAIFLSACASANPISTADARPPVKSSRTPGIAPAFEATIEPAEAARLAKQASFGPTPELVNAIVAKKSVSAWLNEQFELNLSTYSDFASRNVPNSQCKEFTGLNSAVCNRDYFSAAPIQMRFYANAVSKDDQLRQRVAFALSQIIVASEVDVHSTAGLAAFEQILLSKAFGNYRDILKAVTLSPFMGGYLDMADSNKNQPNENYARELLQLFSIGTELLNPDGTPKIDSRGVVIPSYNNSDVKEVARALTGWTWGRFNGAPFTDYTNRDWSNPMVMYAARYDTGAKTFLGKTVPANASQQASVDAVVDAVFNHPNTGPYISKRLIQQLTVANPTPAYVERVAAAFADNGSGVRGDLKAVVRAIYLDSEARTISKSPGKVKEPVLLTTSLARAIGFKTDGFAFTLRDSALGQAPFRAPSVFNFYPYEFPLPLGAGLDSPASKLMTGASVIARHNFVYDWTVDGDGTRTEFAPQANIAGSTGTFPDWAPWEAFGTDDGKILDRINLLLLNGTMTKDQQQSLLKAMAAIKNSNPSLQTRKRAQMALYVVASSPLFQADR
jgi:uncharacterized protein (DUF1800 family)